ncbi:MAG: hypothetical protein EAX81_08705 [Candidatus Thorarchaeota archaeon]|nr:hypothetical protein [Candidatus Thorarchaeota archaeon]
MSEPYKDKQIMDHWKIVPTKKVVGHLIALTGLRLTNRVTWIIHPRTRACPKYCIIELTVTDETDIQPGTKVSSVVYLGFAEITVGGLVVTGQTVTIQGVPIGKVVGFSEIHYPNHLNIIVSANEAFASDYLLSIENASNANLRYKLDDQVVFEAFS